MKLPFCFDPRKDPRFRNNGYLDYMDITIRCNRNVVLSPRSNIFLENVIAMSGTREDITAVWLPLGGQGKKGELLTITVSPRLFGVSALQNCEVIKTSRPPRIFRPGKRSRILQVIGTLHHDDSPRFVKASLQDVDPKNIP